MPPTSSPSDPRVGALKLALGATIVAVVWLVVLPAVGRQPAVRAQIENNQKHDIDAGARFYTELPGLTAFLDRVQTNRRRAGDAFWRPAFAEPTMKDSATQPTSAEAPR